MALEPVTVLRVGGAAYKAALIMENKADIYLYLTDYYCYTVGCS